MGLGPAQRSAASANSPSRAQQSLARRFLFPNTTTDLPPLLTAQNVPPDLQAELYDVLALALRAYVNPWWTKITRYDKELLPQITHIVTTVIRALEARTLALDLPPLLFHDAPIILTQHFRDYRNAASKLSTSYATGGATSLPHLFHQLQPHIALSSDASIDLQYYRQILDHILKACLPPEDYEPEAERYIVREVILKVLVQDIIPHITQPWFIQKSILDILGSDDHDNLFQSFSSTCLALIHLYKQAVTTIRIVNRPPSNTPVLPHSSTQDEIGSLSATPNTPSISSTSIASCPSPSVSRKAPITSPTSKSNPHQHANYSSPLLTVLSEVFLTTERLSATYLMTLLGIITAAMQPFLDKLLPHLLYTYLSPAFILNIVRLSKRTLFPNGFPAPPPPDPTPEEQAALKQRLTSWRGSGGLSHLTPFFLGNDTSTTLSAAIEPLTSQPCNVHLLVILLDRVLVGLFPELIGSPDTAVDFSLNGSMTVDPGNQGDDVDGYDANNPNYTPSHGTTSALWKELN
ncbi:hypothetical protein AGABI1DRAFT_103816 [Agaricus bisporus var. burnettii JB137-S8]|uniref:PXA domain-containing protein n=1 Tax=Agaricus bisporus var. burnettii (strain JB137-S8 / ATCC MYA-4627 / FGSC 10392) TaxID=597362 RepID=K5Y6B5_AGABU|nr:uncharacterized protein AGABI1DRAFT_103816 [Agaricus bisporus var. burnettii JB137-S8]EKM83685.1 hypothetical protein AGABI1DRAFT_103816 [Agaricus bisporus var. burnettii JB137-S8]